MQITYRAVKELKQYKNNPRNNDAAVDAVAASIDEFGFRNPIIIDANDVIIAGHTRLKAAKKLKLKEVPTIRVDDLTEEQVNALRLADNKVAELASWDVAALDRELDKILDIDMSEFGFDLGDYEPPDYSEVTQDRVENILGLGIQQFEGDGYFDIPMIYGTQEIPQVDEWIGFNYVLSDDNPEGKGVHFFVDDYQFERVWNDPERYAEKLKPYAAVLAPDFSPYGDMPLACQIWNHYRKHWCAAFWQSRGINVIPTIRSSTDPRSLDFYLEGEPKNSVVAISTMWASGLQDEMRMEYETMMEELEPSHIIVYGPIQEYMDKENVTRIPTFTDNRFGGK